MIDNKINIKYNNNMNQAKKGEKTWVEVKYAVQCRCFQSEL